MNSNLLSILYSAGMVQALVLAVLLLRKGVLRSRANQIMLTLLLAILIVTVQYMLVINGQRGKLPIMAPLSIMSWFAIGPLFFLYSLAKSRPDFRFRRIHLLYFIFPAYNLLQYLLYLLSIDWGFYVWFDNAVLYSYTWLFAYLIHSLFFSLLALRHIRKAAQKKDRNLLRFFYVLITALALSSLYLAIRTNSFHYHNEIERYLVVLFDGFVIMLSFGSLYSSPIFKEDISGAKYSNSGLSATELSLSHERLLSVMKTEKPYLDRKLSLKHLSELSQIKENQLSQIFSQHLGSSFYDFINAYRLSEVEERLAEPKYRHLKITGLAEDCGFNSKAAFYKAFKEKHGLSPTQYMQQKKPLD